MSLGPGALQWKGETGIREGQVIVRGVVLTALGSEHEEIHYDQG